ncbi:MAG: hypothetical protein V3T62_05580 [Alphaproteobacteria bacterium]
MRRAIGGLQQNSRTVCAQVGANLFMPDGDSTGTQGQAEKIQGAQGKLFGHLLGQFRIQRNGGVRRTVEAAIRSSFLER